LERSKLVRKLVEATRSRRYINHAVAQKLGVSDARISKWLAGVGIPNPYQARAWGEMVGLDLDYLTDDGLDVPPSTRPDPQRALDEVVILEIARVVGYDEAKSRLMKVAKPVVRFEEPAPSGAATMVAS
jgi:hypothetical protein